MPQDRLLTLEANRWYSWQMMPGYGDGFLPYVSPILVREIKLLKTGRHELELVFFNALYAHGVQDFSKRIKVLSRRSNYLVASDSELGNDTGKSGRDVIIGEMSFEWLNRYLPEWCAERPKGADIGNDRLASERYLSLRFFGTEFPWRAGQP